MTHIHWLPQPDFLKLAAKITLPRLGAPPFTLADVVNPTPLEEMTIMDFRRLTQPHDLRSQLGLAMSPEPDLLEGSTVTITVDVHADEPSRLGDQIAKMIGQRAANVSSQLSLPGYRHILGASCMTLDARAIHRLVPAGQILINGQTVEDFLVDKPEGVVPVKESEITALGEMTTDLASVLRGMHVGGPIKSIDKLNEAERFYGEPVDPRTMKPYANDQAGMKSRLDTLDQETLALLVEVGNRPGHDRRRVDAARTQLELAFMMLKRAIEEG